MDSRALRVTRVQLETKVYRVQEDTRVHNLLDRRALEVSKDS